jgi:hypothetical protein
VIPSTEQDSPGPQLLCSVKRIANFGPVMQLYTPAKWPFWPKTQKLWCVSSRQTHLTLPENRQKTHIHAIPAVFAKKNHFVCFI